MKEIQKFESIVKRFPNVKVLVVGDIMMDRSIIGRVSRISPEAPVPVLVEEKDDFELGGAANVANNIQSLGGKVSLCGLLGKDADGDKLLGRIKEKGINTDGIFREEGRPTTLKTRIFAHHPHHQQLVRIDRETIDHPKPKKTRSLIKFLEANFEGFNVIVISDYGKGLLTKKLIRTIIEEGRKLNKLVMVDPKMKNFRFYNGASVVTSNIKEASEKTKVIFKGESSVEKMGRKLLYQLRCNVLVITQGKEGMTIFDRQGKPCHIENAAREVFDVTGAGDTVIGTMALALGAKAKVMEAAWLANHTAGIAVRKKGTATVTSEELIETIKRGV